jgi:cytochrome P450
MSVRSTLTGMPLAPVATPTTPPGNGGLPYVGHMFSYIRDPHGFLRRRHEEFGPVSWIRAMGRRWVCLLGADASEAVFRNADRALANGPAWSYLVGPFFDRGLMLLDFEEHHRHRRIMQQAFTADRIAGYTDAMHDPVEASLDAWETGEDVRAYPALKRLTLDLATQLLMGGASDATPQQMAAVNQAFVQCVQAATAVVRLDLPGTRWRQALRGRELLEEFLEGYLPRARAHRTDDLFSALCHARSDEGEEFTDRDVVNHMIFLLMAAHDTSTITLSTMMQYLGQHPEWQERCRAEVLTLDERPSLRDHRAMPSIDLVMRECMRLVAPVPVVVRQAVKDTEALGHRIPRGTMVMTSPAFTHHDPSLWPDPARFDPERFAPQRREDKVHRYAWHPFGGGVHKCLGMHFAGAEITTVMAHLLRRYTWSVDPDYVCPLDYTSLPFPSDGQPVDLRPHRARIG